jgi:cobalt-precorrin 5A hydrolase
MRYVAGLGCRRDCEQSSLRELLLHTLALHSVPISALSGLASSEHKQTEPALLQLASELQLPLYWLSPAQLQPYDSRLSQHSALSRQLTGSAGVAEASALALAEYLSGGRAGLLGPRQHNASATCALAVAPIMEPA